MRITSATSSRGVCEQLFDLGEIPGALWTPEGAAGPRPLILMGHGGGQHKKAPGIVAHARRFVAESRIGHRLTPGHDTFLLATPPPAVTRRSPSPEPCASPPSLEPGSRPDDRHPTLTGRLLTLQLRHQLAASEQLRELLGSSGHHLAGR